MLSANASTDGPNCNKSFQTLPNPSQHHSTINSAPHPSHQEQQNLPQNHPQNHQKNSSTKYESSFKLRTDSFPIYSPPRTRDFSTLQPPSYNEYHSLYAQNQPDSSCQGNGRYLEEQAHQQLTHRPSPLIANEDVHKGYRLRKACDSCSIRKVKVGTRARTLLIYLSILKNQ